MKKILFAFILTVVSVNLFAANAISANRTSVNSLLTVKTKPTVTKKMFVALTVDFTLSCGTLTGAQYTCNGCSQSTIESDLNYYAAYYEASFCGTSGPGSWCIQ